MLLVYEGPHDAVEVPDAELICVRGEPIEVPEDVAKRLLHQHTWIRSETDAEAKARIEYEKYEPDVSAVEDHEERDHAHNIAVLEANDMDYAIPAEVPTKKADKA